MPPNWIQWPAQINSEKYSKIHNCIEQIERIELHISVKLYSIKLIHYYLFLIDRKFVIKLNVLAWGIILCYEQQNEFLVVRRDVEGVGLLKRRRCQQLPLTTAEEKLFPKIPKNPLILGGGMNYPSELTWWRQIGHAPYLPRPRPLYCPDFLPFCSSFERHFQREKMAEMAWKIYQMLFRLCIIKSKKNEISKFMDSSSKSRSKSAEKLQIWRRCRFAATLNVVFSGK